MAEIEHEDSEFRDWFNKNVLMVGTKEPFGYKVPSMVMIAEHGPVIVRDLASKIIRNPKLTIHQWFLSLSSDDVQLVRQLERGSLMNLIFLLLSLEGYYEMIKQTSKGFVSVEDHEYFYDRFAMMMNVYVGWMTNKNTEPVKELFTFFPLNLREPKKKSVK